MMSDSQYLFVVVEFNELINNKKCVELLPISWLFENDEMCYYPPKKDFMKVEKWVENQRVPGEAWPTYPITIIAKARDYDQGLRKLKRSYKKKDVNSSDSESQLQTTSASVSQLLATPRPLINYKGNIQNDSACVRPTAHLLNPIHEESEEELTLPGQPHIYEFKEAIEDLKKFIKTEISNAKRSILYDLDQKMNVLKLEIGRKGTITADHPHPWKLIDTDLPANDLESFLKFEEILKIDTTKQEALKEIFRLETIGSTNYDADISSILKKLIGKTVQLQYSGCGRVVNGVGKKNFSATEFYKHMNDFLMIKYKESKEILKIVHATSKFFSGAKDRDGGRAQRTKKI